jgi:hypothetical protein
MSKRASIADIESGNVMALLSIETGVMMQVTSAREVNRTEKAGNLGCDRASSDSCRLKLARLRFLVGIVQRAKGELLDIR